MIIVHSIGTVYPGDRYLSRGLALSYCALWSVERVVGAAFSPSDVIGGAGVSAVDSITGTATSPSDEINA